MLDDYTRLLTVLAESEDATMADEAVAKLVLHLKSTGRIKLLSGIAQRLRTIAAHRARRAARVEIAHARESSSALAAAATHGIDAAHAVVNPSLISGFRAQKGGLLVDRSAKRALLELYQNLTV